MILDQADHLRRLMRGAHGAGVSDFAPRPRWVVLAGGKGGVGTTTIAVNLAVALARQGKNTLLVDGDLGKADAAALCGAREGAAIGDVLAGRRRLEEAIQKVPAGISVLPGAWATGQLTDCNPTAQERLIAALSDLGEYQWVVVDAGCGLNRSSERFWQSADPLLLVTSPESTSLMNAYAAVKTFSLRHGELCVQSVINLAVDHCEARESHSRLAVACRRFLGLQIGSAACFTHLPEITAAARRRTPFVSSSPDGAATQIMEQLARMIHRPTSLKHQVPGENLEIEQTIQAIQA